MLLVLQWTGGNGRCGGRADLKGEGKIVGGILRAVLGIGEFLVLQHGKIFQELLEVKMSKNVEK